MKCMNQCDYPSDDGGPCRCAQDAAKMQILDEDKLLMHSEYRQQPEVYAVYAKNIDRDILLGYCTSESKEDIEAYYDDKKYYYGLMIEQVQPVKIPAGFAAKKNELILKKNEIERQLKEINRG